MELLLFIKSVLPWKHYCCSCYCRLRCYADIHGSCCCCWFLSWNCLTSILTLLLVFSAYLTHTHAHTLLLQLAVVISAKRSVNEVSERAISDFRKHIKIELWHMRATTHTHGYKPAIGCDCVSARIFKCFSCVCVSCVQMTQTIITHEIDICQCACVCVCFVKIMLLGVPKLLTHSRAYSHSTLFSHFSPAPQRYDRFSTTWVWPLSAIIA